MTDPNRCSAVKCGVCITERTNWPKPGMGMLKIHGRENDGRHFQFIMDAVDLTGITLTPPLRFNVSSSR